jgi:hypothetical protein
MKSLFFGIIICTAFSINAEPTSKSIKGKMDCRVTGNFVIASEEGKLKQYSGMKDGVELNEQINLIYSASKGSLYASLERPKKQKNNIVINVYFNLDDTETQGEKSKRGVILKNNLGELSFLDDYIRINSLSGSLYLRRYYKNDWHGIYARIFGPDTFTHTITLDCRHTEDRMEEALTELNK